MRNAVTSAELVGVVDDTGAATVLETLGLAEVAGSAAGGGGAPGKEPSRLGSSSSFASRRACKHAG